MIEALFKAYLVTFLYSSVAEGVFRVLEKLASLVKDRLGTIPFFIGLLYFYVATALRALIPWVLALTVFYFGFQFFLATGLSVFIGGAISIGIALLHLFLALTILARIVSRGSSSPTHRRR
jgi:hypothetical protein